MTAPQKIHPHDVGLPEPAIRKRRRSRRVAHIMLTIFLVTALAGWIIFGDAVRSAVRMKSQNPFQAIGAWALLIVSSTTLVLGLWYLLLAQVERIARIVEADEADPDPAHRLCPNCGWFFDPPDRYCRHCGKPLGTNVAAPNPRSG